MQQLKQHSTLKQLKSSVLKHTVTADCNFKKKIFSLLSNPLTFQAPKILNPVSADPKSVLEIWH